MYPNCVGSIGNKPTRRQITKIYLGILLTFLTQVVVVQ